MPRERLYEEIDATHRTAKMDEGPNMFHDQLRLGRVMGDGEVTFHLYYFRPGGCEWFELTEEAAELLRDQLTEALGPKSHGHTGTMLPGLHAVIYPNTFGNDKLPITAFCNCGRPWHSTSPPPPCPIHGPAQETKVTC